MWYSFCQKYVVMILYWHVRLRYFSQFIIKFYSTSKDEEQYKINKLKIKINNI